DQGDGHARRAPRQGRPLLAPLCPPAPGPDGRGVSGRTLVDAFLANAERRGDHVLCRFGGRQTSWRRARANVDRLAAEVRSRGLGRGDRVALAMGSRPEFLESYPAVLR